MRKVQMILRVITCMWTLIMLPILGGEWQQGALPAAVAVIGVELLLLWASGFFRMAVKAWRETI